LLGEKNWIPLCRAEYVGYDLEEAMDQIKLEMLRIVGEEGEEDGGDGEEGEDGGED
jgi:hypothetical protein